MIEFEYDEVLLQKAMVDGGLNFFRIAKMCKPQLDPKTVKRVITTGTGHPDSVRIVATALGYELRQLVKRSSQEPALTGGKKGRA